jgi:hypothetical protein
VHVTIVICAHAVARKLFLRPLWNRSALLVSPPLIPGVLALDAKPTTVIVMIAAKGASRVTNGLLDTAVDALPIGSVRPATRSCRIPPLVI